MSARSKAHRPTAAAAPPTSAAEPTMEAGGARRSWLLEIAAPGALLLLYFLLSVSAIAEKGNTYDETAHLTAGKTYWSRNVYRLQPENGNLPQRWGALPLMLRDDRLPPTTDQWWRFSEVFRYGYKFFWTLGNNTEQMLLTARTSMLVMGAALGLLVYRWSRRLYGTAGGLVSLTLFALCPTMLAHGPLITSDITAALFFLLSVAAIWKLLHAVTPVNVLLCGLAIGGLCISKFSAPLIAPMAAIMLIVRLIRGTPLPVKLQREWLLTERSRQALALTAALTAQVLVIAFVIWAAYGFRYAGSDEPLWRANADAVDTNLRYETFWGGWEEQFDGPGVTRKLIRVARDFRLLPEAYLYGFAYVIKHSEMRMAYLNGEFSLTGWLEFFPLAMLYKTPLASVAVLGLALAAAVLRWRGRGGDSEATNRAVLDALYVTTPIWALLAVYWPAALASNLNIGHRHVLLTYPAAYILAGSAGWFFVSRRRIGAALTGAMLAVLLACSLWMWPSYLAYFNVIAGGPSNGWKHLVDSSLDWGQDLPGLRRWLEKNNTGAKAEPAYLAYFGTGLPSYYRIPAEEMITDAYGEKPAGLNLFLPLRPGLYAISATYLTSTYLPAPGKWTTEYEQVYQSLKSVNDAHMANLNNKDFFNQLIAQYGEGIIQRYAAYPAFRLARMNAFLRRMQPIDNVGHSILIFRLTQGDIDRMLKGAAPIGF